MSGSAWAVRIPGRSFVGDLQIGTGGGGTVLGRRIYDPIGLATVWIFPGLGLRRGIRASLSDPDRALFWLDASEKVLAGRIERSSRKGLFTISRMVKRSVALHAIGSIALDEGKMERAEWAGRALVDQANGMLATIERFGILAEPLYSDALLAGRILLGRAALRAGRAAEAERYLMEAADNRGSETLAAIGPDMSLAQDLLDHGSTQVVIDYLEACRRLRPANTGRLDAWIAEIQSGGRPRLERWRLVQEGFRR